MHHVLGLGQLSKLHSGLQSAMKCYPAACNLTDELQVILIIKKGINCILVLLKVVSEAARKSEDIFRVNSKAFSYHRKTLKRGEVDPNKAAWLSGVCHMYPARWEVDCRGGTN